MPIRSTVFCPPDNAVSLFPGETFVGAAIEHVKFASTAERGEVFTRGEVADFILDLLGYTPDRALWEMRLLEPSFGGGAFLLRAIRRLLDSASSGVDLEQLGTAICGVELHRDTFERTRIKVLEVLRGAGLSESESDMLAQKWLLNDDFLLAPFSGGFDFIVGNPPYIRQELIPSELLVEYRQRYVTFCDRADLYVPFMERSLRLLQTQGQLGFICSDRWMKNKYGRRLREMISSNYTLHYYVDMVGTSAFQSEVAAYPGITVIEKGRSQRKTRVFHRPEISSHALISLCHALKDEGCPECRNGVSEFSMPLRGSDPWLLESDALLPLDLLRRLESHFMPLEEAGCTVGIGVATGADKVFIAPFSDLDVEDKRKLPLATTRDIFDGMVHWQGLGVLNPFEEDGSLANLSTYPRFAAYIRHHRETLVKRHCAQKTGDWYRTIDRIRPLLAQQPKLLIPDIKDKASIVLESGRLYPHHNLYYITSREWPLTALQRVLLSGIAQLFVRAYSTKMRGGYLRFQAQYLRRIHVPRWQDVPEGAKRVLACSATVDSEVLQKAVSSAYRLGSDDHKYLFTERL